MTNNRASLLYEGPLNYTVPNASHQLPNLSGDAVEVLAAIRAQRPLPQTPFLVMSLREVADRLQCESLADQLRRRGVDAVAPEWPTRGVVGVYVAFDLDGTAYAVNGPFACRMLDRMDSGLTAADAARRTQDQNQKRLTGRQLAELEREAAAEIKAADSANGRP